MKLTSDGPWKKRKPISMYFFICTPGAKQHQQQHTHLLSVATRNAAWNAIFLACCNHLAKRGLHKRQHREQWNTTLRSSAPALAVWTAQLLHQPLRTQGQPATFRNHMLLTLKLKKSHHANKKQIDSRNSSNFVDCVNRALQHNCYNNGTMKKHTCCSMMTIHITCSSAHCSEKISADASTTASPCGIRGRQNPIAIRPNPGRSREDLEKNT